jgi:tRNA A-37 threonylcarbamoyl transferase component Bud32
LKRSRGCKPFDGNQPVKQTITKKKRTSLKMSGIKMKQVQGIQHPSKKAFGFDVSDYLHLISDDMTLPPAVHSLMDTIETFDDSKPIYKHKFCLYSTTGAKGMYIAQTPNDESSDNDTPMDVCQTTLISDFHNIHTESLLCMADELLSTLRMEPSANYQNNGIENSEFKTVYTGNSTTSPGGQTSVLTNCKHMGANVIVKKAISKKDQLRTVLEAVVHLYVEHKHPEFVPKLHFIAFDSDNNLVVCSEQVESTSIHHYIMKTLPREQDQSAALKSMLIGVCTALETVQRSEFTHRDLHTSNIFWNHKTERVTFIDFDWSCIVVRGKKISIPRFLYDTTRKSYGCNKSVDLCIFMRNVVTTIANQNSLRKLSLFGNEVKKVMVNYQAECRQMLCREFDNDQEKHAAFQLYKTCTKDGTIYSEYKHSFGIQRLTDSIEFEYRQGYFEWKSMTPSNVKFFLVTGKFLQGCYF